jgi:hypothetical protein
MQLELNLPIQKPPIYTLNAGKTGHHYSRPNRMSLRRHNRSLRAVTVESARHIRQLRLLVDQNSGINCSRFLMTE